MLGTMSKPTTAGADAYVHSSAFVEAETSIGSGSQIWHHAHVRRGASIGESCVLGKNVYVDAGVAIGNRVKIQNNVSVYSGVTVADDVFIGPSATFTNDKVPRAFNADWKIVPTVVQRGASIGANATVVCGIDIGEYAMVAAGATVTRDVAAHQLVAGTPAHHRGWVCTCGAVVSRDEQRPDSLDCASCGDAS